MIRMVALAGCAALFLALPAVQAREAPPVRGGKLTDSCAPWDGPAFDIRLDNRLTMHVYEALSPAIVGKSFSVGMQQEQEGGGIIMRCGPPYNGCITYEGTVSINAIDGDMVSGTVEIVQKRAVVTHDFRVRHDRSFRPL